MRTPAQTTKGTERDLHCFQTAFDRAKENTERTRSKNKRVLELLGELIQIYHAEKFAAVIKPASRVKKNGSRPELRA